MQGKQEKIKSKNFFKDDLERKITSFSKSNFPVLLHRYLNKKGKNQ